MAASFGETVVARGPGLRARRSLLLAIVGVAAALVQAQPVYATPLPSEVPAAGSVVSHSQASVATIGISLWSYVHPGSTDQDEMTIDAQTSVPAVAAEAPRWVAGPPDEQGVDRTGDVDDPSLRLAGAGPGGLRLFSLSGNSRSVRYSSGGARFSRITSDPQSASTGAEATDLARAAVRLAADTSGRALPACSTRLFRPPRV